MAHATIEGRREYARKWYAKNREKAIGYHKSFHERNPDANRRYAKVTRARAKERIAGRPRPETCELCLEKRSRIVFEHDHKTGAFRGWLCHRCNLVLGAVKDNPDLLRKLAQYLENPKGAIA